MSPSLAGKPAAVSQIPVEPNGPVALGADHGGFELKQTLKAYLEGSG